MERVSNHEGEERKRALEAAARRYGTELLHANLIIPQTYGAIRTLGAHSILTETKGGYDFSPSELYEALREIEDEVATDFYEQMLAAHKASFVEVDKFKDKTPEEIFTFAASIFRYHERVAQDGAVKALKFAKKYLEATSDEEIHEKAIAILALMREALLDERLREQIRMYKLNVAMEKESKHAFAEQLALEWGRLFMQKLQTSSLAPATPEKLRPIAMLFQDMAMSESYLPDKVDKDKKAGTVVE